MGDKVELVGMVGAPPDAVIEPTLRFHFDALMEHTFNIIDVTIGDEGTVVETYSDGWAKVIFPEWEEPIDTPQANLKVIS